MILVCDFLDNHAESIGTKSKTLTLCNGSRVPIYRHPAGKTEENFKPRPSLDRPKRKSTSFRRVRIAQRIVLAPQTETVVLALCDEAGTCFFQPEYKLFNQRQLHMTNGFVDIQSNVPFPVIMANFASVTTSHKCQALGRLVTSGIGLHLF